MTSAESWWTRAPFSVRGVSPTRTGIMAASGPGQELAAAVALEHHVRVDGGGYPSLKGRRPALFSRMVAIVDAYDAITSYRPYRPARTPNEALRVLLDGAGTIHDPDVLRLFIEMMGHYPPGSLLRLAPGRGGPSRPGRGRGHAPQKPGAVGACGNRARAERRKALGRGTRSQDR